MTAFLTCSPSLSKSCYPSPSPSHHRISTNSTTPEPLFLQQSDKMAYNQKFSFDQGGNGRDFDLNQGFYNDSVISGTTNFSELSSTMPDMASYSSVQYPLYDSSQWIPFSDYPQQMPLMAYGGENDALSIYPALDGGPIPNIIPPTPQELAPARTFNFNTLPSSSNVMTPSSAFSHASSLSAPLSRSCSPSNSMFTVSNGYTQVLRQQQQQQRSRSPSQQNTTTTTTRRPHSNSCSSVSTTATATNNYGNNNPSSPSNKSPLYTYGIPIFSSHTDSTTSTSASILSKQRSNSRTSHSRSNSLVAGLVSTPSSSLETSSSSPQAWRCAYPGCTSRATFTRGCDLRKHYNRHSKHLFCRVEGCPQSETAAIARARTQNNNSTSSSNEPPVDELLSSSEATAGGTPTHHGLLLTGGFSSKKDRARHEAKHNPGIKCEWHGPDGEECGRVFSRMDNMKDHVRRIHRKGVVDGSP